MEHDLVVSPFGASASEMIDVARCAEASGFGGVWTYDHMTGSMLERGHSHDVFAILGAMSIATERVRIGPLVANMMSRHPVQLAVAMATLQSLSDGRAVLGVGAGAAPDSRFAREHEAIGTALLDRMQRLRMLVETIQLVRHVWHGRAVFRGEFFRVDDLDLGSVLADTRHPPIIVGASSRPMIEVAVEHADGVNLASGGDLADLLLDIKQCGVDSRFEISAHVPIDFGHPTGGALPKAVGGQLTRLVLAVSAPFDLVALARLGARLGES